MISDFFWGVINVVTLFIMTFFNPTKPLPKRSSSSYNPNRSSAAGFRDGVSSGAGGPRGRNVRGMDSIRNRPGDCAAGG